MKRFYVRFRGNFYAYGPIEASSIREARRWAREHLNVKRFYGEVWETK